MIEIMSMTFKIKKKKPSGINKSFTLTFNFNLPLLTGEKLLQRVIGIFYKFSDFQRDRQI